MIRSSTFGHPYGYASYGVFGDPAAEEWEEAKNNLLGAYYAIDEAGWVYYLVWTRDMVLPTVTVVWSPKSRKELSFKVDPANETAIRNLVLQIYRGGRTYGSSFDDRNRNKEEAIAYAKSLIKGAGGKKPTSDTSLTTSGGGGRMTTSGGGGRMTTSGGGVGRGSSTPFYKNPWVIGGTAVAVLGIVLVFALSGKGKTT